MLYSGLNQGLEASTEKLNFIFLRNEVLNVENRGKTLELLYKA